MRGWKRGHATAVFGPASCLSFVLVLMLVGCASYRDTSLDHRLPDFTAPTLNLDGLKSVQKRAGQRDDIAFAVAISGGGHRAANFGVGVLVGLESASSAVGVSNLLREVDYFSTVSGGGFAAGAYLSALHDHLQGGEGADTFRFKAALAASGERLLGNLRRDYQSTVFAEWLDWRCMGYRDAGDLMEMRFDRYLLGSKYRADRRSMLLGDIFKRADSSDPVHLPYWITNATVYENGARFMFVPGFVSHYGMNRFVHNMRYGQLKGDPFALPLAVGMKASASFPVVFPASTFTCRAAVDPLNPYLHLVDGGLTDNLGVESALELLQQDAAPRKVLLVVDAYTRSEHPYSAYRASPDGAGVAYRVMKMGLDAAHLRARPSIRKAVAAMREASGCEVELLFLGFDELQPAMCRQVTALEADITDMRKARRDALSRRVRRHWNYSLRRKAMELGAARQGCAATHSDASAVATSLNITRAEQAVLLEAGRMVLQRNLDALQRVFRDE